MYHQHLVSDLHLIDRTTSWQYMNRLIAAPMVRISTLPFRLLSTYYGADMVYSEELIAQKLSKCVRSYNEQLDTIDFRLPSNPQSSTGQLVLSTYTGEPLVVQIGVSNGTDALLAANVVSNDCNAIDINMGCPKQFSVQGNMGSALLTDITAIDDIIKILKRNTNKPITCKIRLLETDKKTVDLVRHIQSLSVSAIGVHCRTVPDRPNQRASPHRFAAIYDVCNTVECPIMYNGDAFDYDDIDRIKKSTHCNSLLLARGSMWNASIFRYNATPVATPSFTSVITRMPMLPLHDVILQYICIARQYLNLLQNSKYCITEMLKLHIGKSPVFEKLNRSKTYDDLQAAVHMLRDIPACTAEYCPPRVAWQSPKVLPASLVECEDQPCKRHKSDNHLLKAETT